MFEFALLFLGEQIIIKEVGMAEVSTTHTPPMFEAYLHSLSEL